MSSKTAALRFRAVARPKGSRGYGPLNVEFSRDGVNWQGSVNGLDVAEVRSQFTRLKGQGAVIVDTDAYKHEKPS